MILFSSDQSSPVNANAHSSSSREVTLAYCTGGYTMFGRCWPGGTHETLDTLPGSPGHPQIHI